MPLFLSSFFEEYKYCLLDILKWKLSGELEYKLAAGRDSKGALPEDFWPTYCAFANTNGGVVLLGVKEKKDIFTLEGIENPGKIRAELFGD